jgi:hypothetical protein
MMERYWTYGPLTNCRMTRPWRRSVGPDDFMRRVGYGTLLLAAAACTEAPDPPLPEPEPAAEVRAEAVPTAQVPAVSGEPEVTTEPDDPPEPWRVVEEWRVGAAEGEAHELFGGPTVVGVDPLGRVHVIDFQAQDIRVFDPDGRFVRRIGGAGGGPGEFDGPLSMAWDTEARLWVADGWNARYTVFDSTGTVDATWPRRLSMHAFRQRLHVLPDGSLLDEASGQDESGRAVIHLVRIVPESDLQDTVLTVASPQPPRRSALPTVPRAPAASSNWQVYLSALVHAIAPDGTVWVARSGAYRAVRLSLSGDTLQVVEAQHRSMPLTSEEEDLIRSGLRETGRTRDEVLVERPIIQRLIPLPDGHLLVQVTEEVGEVSDLFDVFDPESRLVGSVRSGFLIGPRTIPAVRGDTLYAIVTAELDLPQLVKATLLRPR